MGSERYVGKVCPKHPELQGERYACGGCRGCKRATTQRRMQNPQNQAKQKASYRKWYEAPGRLAEEAERNRVRRQDPEYRARANRTRVADLKKQYASDPAYALLQNIRCRTRQALQGKQKAASTLALLGVESIEQYKSYLEKQFELGMNWENYGKGWHVDHRIPLSLLELKTPEDQNFAFGYRNTRPMWAEKNKSRGNRLVFEDLI